MASCPKITRGRLCLADKAAVSSNSCHEARAVMCLYPAGCPQCGPGIPVQSCGVQRPADAADPALAGHQPDPVARRRCVPGLARCAAAGRCSAATAVAAAVAGAACTDSCECGPRQAGQRRWPQRQRAQLRCLTCHPRYAFSCEARWVESLICCVRLRICHPGHMWTADLQKAATMRLACASQSQTHFKLRRPQQQCRSAGCRAGGRRSGCLAPVRRSAGGPRRRHCDAVEGTSLCMCKVAVVWVLTSYMRLGGQAKP